jgi:hypothetical protein
MMIELWEEFEDEIKFYQASFAISVFITLSIMYMCS